MEIFVLRPATNWERGSGAAVIIAKSVERVQKLMREYEFEEDLIVYATDDDANADVAGPFRHTWVEVERFPTAEDSERIVILSWDEEI
ncbi:MAG TPA: hypothetical protein VIR57_14160 [Chloroflexota bacterium]